MSNKRLCKAEFNIGQNIRYMVAVLALIAVLGASPGSAALVPSFTMQNQAGWDVSANQDIGFSDTLYLTDKTENPDDVRTWYWNVSAPGKFKHESFDKNAQFLIDDAFLTDSFGTIHEGAVEVNLRVRDALSASYSAVDVFYVRKAHPFMKVGFTADLELDDRSTANPNGTLKLTDDTGFQYYPTESASAWAWRVVDLNEPVSLRKTYESDGSSISDIPLNQTRYQVDFTVKSNLGNIQSVRDELNLPEDIPTPISKFVVTPMTGRAPLEISVTDQSESMVAHLKTNLPLAYNYTIWNTSDSSVIPYWGPEPDYSPDFNLTISTPGEFRVVQNVTNSFGKSSESTVAGIVIDEPAFPDITVNASFVAVPERGNPPQFVTFTDSSWKTEKISYLWNFGDGSDPVMTQNATHLFATPGEYPVTLTITGESGNTDSMTRIIPIEKLSPDFTYTVNGWEVTFTDISKGFPQEMLWRFGDGQIARVFKTGMADDTVVHEYPQAGEYTVSLAAATALTTNETTRQITV